MASPRTPSTEKSEQLRPNFLWDLDEYAYRANQQIAKAREMAETAREMSHLAAEMRKKPRLLLP